MCELTLEGARWRDYFQGLLTITFSFSMHLSFSTNGDSGCVAVKGRTVDRYAAQTNRGRDTLIPAAKQQTPRRVQCNWKIPHLIRRLLNRLSRLQVRFTWKQKKQQQPKKREKSISTFSSGRLSEGTEQAPHLDNDRFSTYDDTGRRSCYIWWKKKEKTSPIQSFPLLER